jgi:hypothetical protein
MDSGQVPDRRGGRALLLGCLLVLLLSGPAAARSTATLTVVDDGVITLHAVDAAWADVVRALADKAGMVVHVMSPPARSITVSYTRLQAAEVIRRLFGPAAGFAFVYGAGPMPIDVWVTPAATTACAAPTVFFPMTMSAPAEVGRGGFAGYVQVGGESEWYYTTTSGVGELEQARTSMLLRGFKELDESNRGRVGYRGTVNADGKNLW